MAKGCSDHHHAVKPMRQSPRTLLSAKHVLESITHWGVGVRSGMVFGIRLFELQNQSPNLPCKCIRLLCSSGSSLDPQQQQKQWAKNDNYAVSGFSGKKVLLGQTGAFGTLLYRGSFKFLCNLISHGCDSGQGLKRTRSRSLQLCAAALVLWVLATQLH